MQTARPQMSDVAGSGNRAIAPEIRKAAILVKNLDRSTADSLLSQMPAALAVKVRRAVLHVDDVSPDEQNRVIDEFMRFGSLVPVSNDGVELDESLARRMASAPVDPPPPVAADEPAGPFHFLRTADPAALARFLLDEHPQTTAVVVAHLPPNRAADLIAEFDQETQADVLLRVANLDQADDDSIREIEHELQTRLARELERETRRTAAVNNVSAILRALSGGQRQDVLSQMVRRDEAIAGRLVELRPGREKLVPLRKPKTARSLAKPGEATLGLSATGSTVTGSTVTGSTTTGTVTSGKVASARATSHDTTPSGPKARDAKPVTPERVGQQPLARRADPPRLTFDQVSQFSDTALAATLQRADPQLALLALMGASRPLVDRILRQLPAREARQVRTRLRQTGPLSMSDVDAAQQHVADVASRLIERGLIRVG